MVLLLVIPEDVRMRTAKIAISLDKRTLSKLDRVVKKGVFPSRSSAIQSAVEEHLTRLDRSRLARECAKLDPRLEAAIAEEGLAEEAREWPEY
jgi:Arc/MetJ-type ribon-helix-helix transcriptional regulator